ncbi:TPA: hypothetical protein N0F65_012706 [Lagenidium giganteum]|uniref:Tubby C-terminal domain-containing protein n=1 Tax=Lagenidium giganteum TaxID=4803 RepID=A0AAV2YE18_9STRA|nr:TPA: hypothetical protein N0F65_012706 [Lagenidium giganteum]
MINVRARTPQAPLVLSVPASARRDKDGSQATALPSRLSTPESAQQGLRKLPPPSSAAPQGQGRTMRPGDDGNQVLPFQLDDGQDDHEEIRQRRLSSASSASSSSSVEYDHRNRQRRGGRDARYDRHAKQTPRRKENDWDRASEGHAEVSNHDEHSDSDHDQQPAKAKKDRPELAVRERRGKTEHPDEEDTLRSEATDSAPSSARSDAKSSTDDGPSVGQTAQSSTITTTMTTISLSPSASDYASISKSSVFPGSEHQLLQGDIIRVRSGMTLLAPQYQFFINGQLILMAEKQLKNRTANYHLFDMTRAIPSAKLSKKSGNYIGIVRANFSKKKTVLLGNQSQKTELGVIIYGRSTASSEPRRLVMVLPPLHPKRQEIEGVLVGDSLPDTFSLLAEQFKRNRASKDGIDSRPLVVEQTRKPVNLQVFETKEPVFESGFYRLNFQGRVSVPSVKNFQLVRTKDIGTASTSPFDAPEGTVFLQFGKVDDHSFHLDFRAPITPIQAFAVALAQFTI